ncbi:unnamed protein product [marine sediment metagenome]|uniref:Uncharacterized protein n=1 Tax=marine sediment metagenome TaxID=412755 RepID=X1LPV0_9ZZZZ
MKKQKNYDKKVKNTRILLSDYLLLKGYAQEAGISMSEALHTIITRDWAMSKRKARPVAEPTFIARVKAPVALRVRPQPILTTNGHKAGVFVTKPKGGVIQ